MTENVFFKGLFSYISAKYIVVLLNFIRSILIANILGPSSFGEYALILLILEYLNYSNLGIFHATNKEVAVNLGNKKKSSFIHKVFNTTISFQVLNSLFVGLIFLTLYFFSSFKVFETGIDKDYFFYIFLISLLYQFKNYLILYLRLYENFLDIAKIELIASFTHLFFVYLFIAEFQIDAILISTIVSNIIATSVYIKEFKNFRFFIEKKLILYLLSIAFPLLLFNFLNLIILSLDRLMISNLLTKADLGIYHFGYLLSFGVMTAFNSFIFLIVPKMMKKYSQNPFDVDLMKGQLKLFEIILFFLLVISCIFGPYIIKTLAPDYVDSIQIMKFLLIAYSLNCIAFLPATHLISNNLHSKLFPVFVSSVICAFFLNYFFIRSGFGISGVAVSTIVAYLIYTNGSFINYFKAINLSAIINFIKISWKYSVFIIATSLIIFLKINNFWLIFLFITIYARDIFQLTIEILNGEKAYFK